MNLTLAPWWWYASAIDQLFTIPLDAITTPPAEAIAVPDVLPTTDCACGHHSDTHASPAACTRRSCGCRAYRPQP